VSSRDFRPRLTDRFKLAGFDPAPSLLEKLEVYYELLAFWNQKINLSGMTLSEPNAEALDRLLVEPVVASRHVAPGARRIVDVGSGGGSPAIPFALAIPESQLLMVESKSRKSVFLKEALRALRMHDSQVVTARFENLLETHPLTDAYDIVTVRAVRVGTEELNALRQFVRPGGQIMLFRRNSDEAVVVPQGLQLTQSYPLVKDLQSQLIIVKRMS
jgi:16S rRNA (guanine527-N7)-methyltransferase